MFFDKFHRNVYNILVQELYVRIILNIKINDKSVSKGHHSYFRKDFWLLLAKVEYDL